MAKVEDAEDLGNMLADWDEVEYTPFGSTHPSSKTRTINGIFNRGYLEDSGIMSSEPEFRCKSTDIDDVSVGAKLDYTNVYGVTQTFTVRGYEPNGLGLTYLLLEEDD